MGEEKKVVLELTEEEVLYLRKQVKFEGGYEWEKRLSEGIEEKLNLAYEKPKISRQELEKRIEECRYLWQSRWGYDDSLVNNLERGEWYRLGFLYEITEAKE